MGKYTDEANAFAGNVSELRFKVSEIVRSIQEVKGELPSDDEAISSYAIQEAEAIESLKKKIFDILDSLSLSVKNKAIEIDERILREEKEKALKRAQLNNDSNVENDSNDVSTPEL